MQWPFFWHWIWSDMKPVWSLIQYYCSFSSVNDIMFLDIYNVMLQIFENNKWCVFVIESPPPKFYVDTQESPSTSRGETPPPSFTSIQKHERAAQARRPPPPPKFTVDTQVLPNTSKHQTPPSFASMQTREHAAQYRSPPPAYGHYWQTSADVTAKIW